MEDLQILLDRLKLADKVVVLTGAGISAESGLKTFRGQGGHYRERRVEELATLEGFLEEPGLVWEWYKERIATAVRARPNEGHLAIAELERLLPGFTLITQNVDRLHQRAGSKAVVELHGNFFEGQCLDCAARFPRPLDTVQDTPCLCEDCGGLVRPLVVWFGEALPQEALFQALSKSKDCDVFLAVGTSGVVFPAAQLPLDAKRTGALVVEVNTEATPLTPSADVFLEGPAGTVLPRIVEAFKESQ